MIWRSIYFIQKYPVKREIFAWDFRDRVIHHLIYNYIAPIFEKEFIYDSYSCRIWKWTSFWIKRINRFIRSATSNYTRDAYIVKLDIVWYFMSLNKNILYEKIDETLKRRMSYPGFWSKSHSELFLSENLNFILDLIHKIIYNDCRENSIFKWNIKDYIWLPKNKSLFYTKANTWLPIWNLTSQLFSNIYLSDFDKYIKNELWVKYYGRYVDDFILIHNDQEHLKSLIPKIRNYLLINLKLNLHPNKIYFQHYSKWVTFLWAMILPFRRYIKKRTIGNFYQKIKTLNQRLDKAGELASWGLLLDFRATVNSYLWFMRHYKNYGKRKHMLECVVDRRFWLYFDYDEAYVKVSRK